MMDDGYGYIDMIIEAIDNMPDVPPLLTNYVALVNKLIAVNLELSIYKKINQYIDYAIIRDSF